MQYKNIEQDEEIKLIENENQGLLDWLDAIKEMYQKSNKDLVNKLNESCAWIQTTRSIITKLEVFGNETTLENLKLSNANETLVIRKTNLKHVI